MTTETLRRFETRWAARWMILLPAAAALPLWFAIAAAKPLDIDEALHIMIARTGGVNWRDFLIALHGDAHPPLFYLALKALLTFESGHVADRAISIVSGGAAIYWFGSILRRLGVRPLLCLLASLAFAFSASLAELATDVRGYAPAMACLLFAFDGLIKLASESDGLRSISAAMVSAGICLAFWTEYSAAVVVMAMVASAAALAFSSAGASLRVHLRQSRAVAAGGTATLALSAAVLYVIHIRNWEHPLNHLRGYYYGDVPGERFGGFLARTTASEIRLFVPGWITNNAFALWFGLVGLAFSAWGAVAVLRRSRSAAHASRFLPAAVTAGTSLAIAAAACARVYPFGARMRHQALLFPFAMISFFVAFDELWRVARPLVRGVIAALLCGAVLGNSTFAAVNAWHFPPPILADAIADRAVSYPERTIIVGQFGARALLAHFGRYRWTFLFPAGRHGRMDLIRIERPGDPILVLRSGVARTLPLREDLTWEIIARTFTELDLSCATVVEVGDRQDPSNASREQFEMAVRRAASRAGLRAEVDDLDPDSLVRVCSMAPAKMRD